MWASKTAQTLERFATPVSRGMTIFGGVALAITMCLVVSDVLGRSLFSTPILGAIDIVGLLLIIVLLSALADGELRKEHITVTIFTDKFSPLVREIVTTSGYFFSTGIAIILSWQLFKQTAYIKAGSLVTGVLRIPEWPFVLLAALFVALFVLALLISFLKQLSVLLSTNHARNYLWLMPGIVLSLGFFAVAAWPSLLPFRISPGIWGGKEIC